MHLCRGPPSPSPCTAPLPLLQLRRDPAARLLPVLLQPESIGTDAFLGPLGGARVDLLVLQGTKFDDEAVQCKLT